MNIFPKLLRVWLLLCLSAGALAQQAPEDNATQMQDQILQLEQGVDDVRVLTAHLDEVPGSDREAIMYRRDQRSFKLLEALDALARRAGELPEDDPQRLELARYLSEDLEHLPEALFSHAEKLDQRIADFSVELESASGSSAVALEAYIYGLRNLRIKSYEATANVLESRTALGLPADNMLKRLSRQLYLHAETLVGRLQFTGSAAEELRGRLANDPQNAELGGALKLFTGKHKEDLARLTAISKLMGRLGLENSAYKAALVQQGQGLSVRDFESDLILHMLGEGWRGIKKSLVDQAPDLLFKLVIVILVLLVFRFLSRLTRRAVKLACERSGADMSILLKDVLASVSSGTVMVIGVLMALSQIGISLGPMLAGLGVAGFIVGFALQDTLGNFAAGGMILIYRPYDVDDFIEVAGAAGLVKKMSLVSTTITTFDNQTLVIPNSKIWGDVIKNVTAQRIRRVDLEFGIGYGDDIEKAERVLQGILEDHESVLKKPESMIRLHTLADSSVNFVVRPWVKTSDYWDVYWDITREVKMRFDREGISIPFPQRDVHIHQDKA